MHTSSCVTSLHFLDHFYVNNNSGMSSPNSINFDMQMVTCPLSKTEEIRISVVRQYLFEFLVGI